MSESLTIGRLARAAEVKKELRSKGANDALKGRTAAMICWASPPAARSSR
jgi:hypothetical protein